VDARGGGGRPDVDGWGEMEKLEACVGGGGSIVEARGGGGSPEAVGGGGNPEAVGGGGSPEAVGGGGRLVVDPCAGIEKLEG